MAYLNTTPGALNQGSPASQPGQMLNASPNYTRGTPNQLRQALSGGVPNLGGQGKAPGFSIQTGREIARGDRPLRSPPGSTPYAPLQGPGPMGPGSEQPPYMPGPGTRWPRPGPRKPPYLPGPWPRRPSPGPGAGPAPLLGTDLNLSKHMAEKTHGYDEMEPSGGTFMPYDYERDYPRKPGAGDWRRAGPGPLRTEHGGSVGGESGPGFPTIHGVKGGDYLKTWPMQQSRYGRFGANRGLGTTGVKLPQVITSGDTQRSINQYAADQFRGADANYLANSMAGSGGSVDAGSMAMAAGEMGQRGSDVSSFQAQKPLQDFLTNQQYQLAEDQAMWNLTHGMQGLENQGLSNTAALQQGLYPYLQQIMG